MPLYPPDDPFLLQLTLFGLPIAVRWYGAIIMSGALFAAWLSAHRAKGRGFDPDHIWNQLMLGLVLGIAGARIYYVSFEWERFAGNPLSVLNLTTGGLAVHGSIIGALLSVLIYTRYAKLPFWEWLDICVPGFLIAQGIGRWGNFFNQEAYGRPTSLPFGVRIDPEFRLPPYDDLQRYPISTLFHPTFLYESLWDITGGLLLLWADRRFGRGAAAERRWLRPGDMLFIYGVIYSAGRFWIEGLRTDSLCLNGVGGECPGSLRVAQLVSLGLIAICTAALVWNHRRSAPQETPLAEA
ncbi:MAG: prolipoprotein diacylglyceryl transferase [Oscillochloris sp.]|nr:prolipoprotein diacylglyceryl transferase [Oscillochloris sp.]